MAYTLHTLFGQEKLDQNEATQKTRKTFNDSWWCCCCNFIKLYEVLLAYVTSYTKNRYNHQNPMKNLSWCVFDIRMKGEKRKKEKLENKN